MIFRKTSHIYGLSIDTVDYWSEISLANQGMNKQIGNSRFWILMFCEMTILLGQLIEVNYDLKSDDVGFENTTLWPRFKLIFLINIAAETLPFDILVPWYHCIYMFDVHFAYQLRICLYFLIWMYKLNYSKKCYGTETISYITKYRSLKVICKLTCRFNANIYDWYIFGNCVILLGQKKVRINQLISESSRHFFGRNYGSS